MRVSLIFFSLFLLLLATIHPSSADYSTKVDPHTTWGEWEGWGTSMAWWANVWGDRDDIADVVFSNKIVTLSGVKQPLPGLNLNIGRYNAGGCSWNTVDNTAMVASPNIPRSKQMEGYWLDWTSDDPSSPSWNWTVDANQRMMMLKAQSRGANIFELFSNSPMWWMCINHNPSGNQDGNSDNLQNWNYKQHAIYLATIALYARDHWGVTFDSVEPFNEPSGNWWTASGTQEGCHFAQSTMAEVAPLLRQALDGAGLTEVLVSASDENTYDEAISTWNYFDQNVKAAVGRVNTHGYQYGGGRRDVLYNITRGKKLWNSEYGEGDSSGLSLASNLNLDLRWLHPTAWVYWQIFDGGGWGMVVGDINSRSITGVNPKYFVFAQYSRHIRPGATIIDGGEGNTISAYDSASQTLVIITTNYETPQWISYDLSGFSSVKGPITRWETNTDGSVLYAMNSTDTNLAPFTFKSYFSKNTIQTFEVYKVTI